MANFSFANLVTGWRELEFEPFRRGIKVAYLVRGRPDEPTIAVLHYAPGARVPRHRHPGVETIVVLDGTQSDESGDYAAGTVIVNPAGSEHSVWTDGGCA